MTFPRVSLTSFNCENVLDLPCPAKLRPRPDWIPHFLLTGTSGDLGVLRPIKIEPEDLDIIQVTVPGKGQVKGLNLLCLPGPGLSRATPQGCPKSSSLGRF